MAETPVSEANQPNPAPGAALHTALVDPVAKAGRQLYDHVAPAIGWYKEHLEDLVHEAKGSRAAARGSGDLAATDVLASLPDARLMSSIPGRVRVRVDALRGNDRLSEETGRALVAVPGVRQVTVSPATGSLLVVYDPRQYRSADLLFQAAGQKGPHAAAEPNQG